MKIESIKNTEITASLRFDGSYHLAEGNLFLRKIKNMPHEELEELCENIFTSGRSKRVYTTKEKGYPYLSNSDVVRLNPFDNCNYNSKKYGYDKTAFLEEGMIVTGRVGAIGQTAYITSEFEEKEAMGSDNIIRIVCKEKDKQGYIYSFLTSKVGTSLIKRLAAGGVQPYISDKMLLDLPIPILSEQKQKEIHQLIVDASDLRVEANRLLEKAISFFNHLETSYSPGHLTIKKISLEDLKNEFSRFDASYNIISNEVDSIINSQDLKFISIKELTEGIFIGPRTKRNYVNSGTPFLSTSEMQKANPTKTDKFLSNKDSEPFKIKQGWILTTRSGTLGDTVIALPCMDGYAVSEDAIRIVMSENSKLTNHYVFAFLKSKLGKHSLISGSYGSVILHLNEDYVGNIKIPILSNDKIQTIEDYVSKYINNINSSILKENQAISLIEKEIDTWQQS